MVAGETRNTMMMIAGAFSGAVAVLHVGCVVVGPAGYRALGAGEQMARLAENGHWYPPTITLAISAVTLLWAFYAWSAAGMKLRLPLRKLALVLITSVYVLRGVAFQPLMAQFPDNSLMFWWVSSGVSFVIGLVHVVGLRQVWRTL